MIRLSPLGIGSIFHAPTKKGFLFKKGKKLEIQIGQEVGFKLKKGRFPGAPRTAMDVVPTDIFHGQVIYLDPTDKSLSVLIGEIICNEKTYLFSFGLTTDVKIGMWARFRVKKGGMAEVISFYLPKPA